MHEGVYGPELPSVRCSTCKRRNDKGTQHAHIEHKVLLLHEQRTQSNVVCVSVNHCLRLESLRAQQQRSQRFDRRLVLKLLTNVDLQVATNRHSLTNLCRTELIIIVTNSTAHTSNTSCYISSQCSHLSISYTLQGVVFKKRQTLRAGFSIAS